MSGEIKLMVSQRSVQESRNLMMNKQGGTHINLVLMLSYAILAGWFVAGPINAKPLVADRQLSGYVDFFVW